MVPAPNRTPLRGVAVKLAKKRSSPRFVSLAISRSSTYTTMMTTTFPRSTCLNTHGSAGHCSNRFAASLALNVLDHNNPALAEMIFPVLALPKLPPPAQKLHPSHAPLSPAQAHLPTHTPPPAHAVPIPVPSRRPPGSPVRTCSWRFSWVAANNARVAPPPPPLVAVSLETASPALAVGCHMVA